MFKKIVFLVLTLSFFLLNPAISHADETEDIQNKITEYSQKLDELGKAKNTLANQIKILTSQYDLTLLKITQTENSIKTLDQEINNLTVKIDDLDKKLNNLASLYVLQIIQNYKLQKNAPPFAFLFSTNLDNYLEQYKYVSSVQKASQNSMVNIQTIKSDYDAQKTDKAEKQQEMETLQKTLATQKTSLNSQKAAKDQLLATTQNDEKKYQQLLTAAQSQLAGLKSFSSGASGSICLSPNQPKGKDNNFYSQRDGLWCNQFINNSSDSTDTIGSIGCAISSYAMVRKKMNSDISPSLIALDPNNFGIDKYSKVLINKLPGKSSYSLSAVKNGLDNGNKYVIMQLCKSGKYCNFDYGGWSHFIVVIGMGDGNGNFDIHDPWYGPDQKLNDHYSVGLINNIRLF